MVRDHQDLISSCAQLDLDLLQPVLRGHYEGEGVLLGHVHSDVRDGVPAGVKGAGRDQVGHGIHLSLGLNGVQRHEAEIDAIAAGQEQNAARHPKGLGVHHRGPP